METDFKNIDTRDKLDRSFGKVDVNADSTFMKMAIVPAMIEDPDNPGQMIPDPEAQASFGSTNLNGNYRSPVDFIAEFVSSNTMQISQRKNFQVIDSSQIDGVKVIHADNTSETFKNGNGGITMTYSADLITIIGATPFVDGDVYEVHINAQEKGWDGSTGSHLYSNITQAKRPPTSIEHLEISTAAIGTTVEILKGFNSHAIHELSGIIASGHVITVWTTHKSDADETLASKNGWTDRTLEIFGEATLSNEPGALGKLKDTMPIMVALEITAAAATAAASDIYYNHFAN